MHQVKVNLRGREKPWSKTIRTEASTAEGILAEMGINPLEVLIKLNGEFVPDTERVSAGDRLDLIEITSRG